MQTISKYLEGLILDDVKKTYIEYLSIEFSKLTARPAKSKQFECLLEVKKLTFSNYQTFENGRDTVLGQTVCSWVSALAAQCIADLDKLVREHITASAERKSLNKLLCELTDLLMEYKATQSLFSELL